MNWFNRALTDHGNVGGWIKFLTECGATKDKDGNSIPYPTIKPILEINPRHVLIEKLKNISDEKLFEEWTYLFCDQAVLAAGGKLDDTAAFVKRLNTLLL